ncbi:PKS-ER domain-containing protein [Mycena sanguinolenta]|uniref:PKS-ER domain-containing protein n=1 Tax=Mycena sanguinolenta TaxID=230812 RepID=A0A8H7D0G2_9AGAR|nr:PKS-ER domain-containing protein [Mycena sanguinolenta]
MSLPRTMRAVICPRVPISPTQLVYTTAHPMPRPKPGHVLTRIKGFGLNRSELYTRQGHSPGLSFPRILGIECVGVVQDAGGGKWKEGDVVAAILGGMGREFDGGYAEYTLVPHSWVSPPISLPQTVGWDKFAAIPETFLAAWGILNNSLRVKATDSLYIHGGSSALGLAVASLAKSSWFNVSTVISTTRTEHKFDTVRRSGADHVILDTGSVNSEVKRLTDGVGAAKAVEIIGSPTLEDTCAAVCSTGLVAVVGWLGDVWRSEFDPMTSLAPGKHLTMFGSDTIDMSTAPLQQIVDAVGSGELTLNVDKVFDIASAGEAHAYMETNSTAGKVVCLVE